MLKVIKNSNHPSSSSYYAFKCPLEYSSSTEFLNGEYMFQFNT